MSFWRFFGNVLKLMWFASVCFFTQIYSCGADDSVDSNGYCNNGFYCKNGEDRACNSATPTVTCAEAGGTCTKCPKGYYCKKGDRYTCRYECTSGSYCPDEGLSEQTSCPTIPANKGYVLVKDDEDGKDKLVYALGKCEKNPCVGFVTEDFAGYVFSVWSPKRSTDITDCRVRIIYNNLYKELTNISDKKNFKDAFVLSGVDLKQSVLHFRFGYGTSSGACVFNNSDCPVWEFEDTGLVNKTGYEDDISCSLYEYSGLGMNNLKGVQCKATPKQYEITLQNPFADNDTTIYTKYDSGAYTDDERQNQMTTSNNNITTLSAANLKFMGYYNTPDSGSMMINKCGFITNAGTNVAKKVLNNDTIWYPHWQNIYLLRISGNGGKFKKDGSSYDNVDYYTAGGYIYEDKIANEFATDCTSDCSDDDSDDPTAYNCKISNFDCEGDGCYNIPTKNGGILHGYINSNGWDVMDEKGNLTDIGKQELFFASDVIVWYAKWTPIHKILLNLNGGSLAQEQPKELFSVNNDTSIINNNLVCANVYKNETVVNNALDVQNKVDKDSAVFTTLPTLSGALFNGFVANGQTVINAAGKLQCVDAITSNQNWVAQWIPIHTITLNKNGGTGENATEKVYVKDGTRDEFKATNSVAVNSSGVQYMSGNPIGISSSNKIIAPTKNNYVFGGYKYGNDIVVDKNGIINVSSPITSSQTWVAQWVPIYEIELNYDGGKVNSVTAGKLYVESGTKTFYTDNTLNSEASSIPAPSKDGYVFDGFLNSNGARVVSASGDSWIINNSLISPVTSGQTWTAKWALCPAGSYCSGGEQKSCPTIDGWTVTSPAGSNSIDDCYATKTINNDDCYGTLRANKNADDNEWTYDTNGVYPNTGYGAPSCENGSCTCPPNKYKITLNKNGGNEDFNVCSGFTTESIYEYKDNACSDTSLSVITTKPTKDGYKFAGYYNQLSGGEQMIDDKGKLTLSGKIIASGLLANTTWYAHWNKMYVITLNVSTTGGKVNGSDSDFLLYTLDNVLYSDNHGQNSVELGSYIPNNITINEYKYTKPTKDNKNFFDGYYNSYSKAAGVKVIDDDGMLTASGKADLSTGRNLIWYAQWRDAKVYPIKLDENKIIGADDGSDVNTILYWTEAERDKIYTDANVTKELGKTDDIYKIPSLPERPGYEFKGYTYDDKICIKADGKFEYTNESKWICGDVAGENITLTAQWDNCTAGYYCPGGEKQECPGYYYITDPQKYTDVSTTYNKCTAIIEKGVTKGYMCNIKEIKETNLGQQTILEQTINTQLYEFIGENAVAKNDCTLALVGGKCLVKKNEYYVNGIIDPAELSDVQYRYNIKEQKYKREKKSVQITKKSSLFVPEPKEDNLEKDYCTECEGDLNFSVNGICSECGPGFYILEDNNTKSCQVCPAGSKCEDPKEGPIQCEINQYSREGASKCSDCADGYSTKNAPEGLCQGTDSDGNGLGCKSPDACRALPVVICLDKNCENKWRWDTLSSYITMGEINKSVIK